MQSLATSQQNAADVRRTAEVKLWQAGGSGTGVSIMSHDSEADRVVAAADQVQEILVEALWGDGRSVRGSI